MSTKKKANKKIETRTEFALVKHAFTREELDTLTGNLTKGLRNIGELQEQKKAVGADYAAKIKTQQAAVSEIANKLDSGFEMKEMACEVDFHYSERMKRFYALRDNGKRGALSKEEPMSEIDLQAQLPLKVEPKKPAKPEGSPADPPEAKPAKKGRKKKVEPGQPLVPVADALEKAQSHEMTPVRGELEGDENDEAP